MGVNLAILVVLVRKYLAVYLNSDSHNLIFSGVFPFIDLVNDSENHWVLGKMFKIVTSFILMYRIDI